jgi:hypothetical protein
MNRINKIIDGMIEREGTETAAANQMDLKKPRMAGITRMNFTEAEEGNR